MKKHSILPHMVLLLFSAACVIPMLLLLATSLTPQSDLVRDGVRLIPQHISLDAYRIVFSDMGAILRAYKISVVVTVVGTAVNIMLCALIAYPLSRKNFRYRSVISFYIYFTVLFNGGIATTYIVVTQLLHLKDTLYALILPLMCSPWIIFLMRTFFQDVPEALFEAATIDGVGEYGIFFKILLPIVTPAVATGTLMIALAYWNDWNSALLYIEDQRLNPIPMMLQNLTEYVKLLQSNRSKGLVMFVDEIPGDGIIAATCLVSVGPVLAVFLFFQKYFIGGITMGAVKE